jgi:hypothetical protein
MPTLCLLVPLPSLGDYLSLHSSLCPNSFHDQFQSACHSLLVQNPNSCHCWYHAHARCPSTVPRKLSISKSTVKSNPAIDHSLHTPHCVSVSQIWCCTRACRSYSLLVSTVHGTLERTISYQVCTLFMLTSTLSSHCEQWRLCTNFEPTSS